MTSERCLTALEIVMQLIPRVRPLVTRIRHRDRGLADQISRAISSIALNLAEADGNMGGNRRMRLESAYGSVQEAKVAMRVAHAWGHIPSAESDQVCAQLDRASAMIWSRMRAR